jgi:hypothetical protein
VLVVAFLIFPFGQQQFRFSHLGEQDELQAYLELSPNVGQVSCLQELIDFLGRQGPFRQYSLVDVPHR